MDAKQRSEQYSGMNFRRLCTILSKYRRGPPLALTAVIMHHSTVLTCFGVLCQWWLHQLLSESLLMCCCRLCSKCLDSVVSSEAACLIRSEWGWCICRCMYADELAWLTHCGCFREIGDKASYTGSHSVLRSKQPEVRNECPLQFPATECCPIKYFEELCDWWGFSNCSSLER